jgi:dephospho-CoA kinase
MRQMPADRPPAAAPPTPFRPATPVVIGLVGGIAAGKSTVAAAFTAHGLAHLDADHEARLVTADPAVLGELAAAFGAELVVQGQLDRAALAARVFADPAARARLEALLHPRIRARLTTALAAAKAAGQSVLLDAPLLLEGGLVAACDHVVFVAASDEVRASRARRRGWPAGELARREAAQLPLADKRARAGFVVENDGELATMHTQVAAILDQLAQPRRRP